MTLLTLADVSVSFGGNTVLHDLSLSLFKGERWGVVGRNGAGKSTIFRLLTGDLDPTSGTVARAAGLRVTHLDQHREYDDAMSVWDAAASGYREVIALDRELENLAARLEELGDRATEADAEHYGRALEQFTHLDGYEFHAKVDAVLQGLGFDPDEARTRSLSFPAGGHRLGVKCGPPWPRRAWPCSLLCQEALMARGKAHPWPRPTSPVLRR